MDFVLFFARSLPFSHSVCPLSLSLSHFCLYVGGFKWIVKVSCYQLLYTLIDCLYRYTHSAWRTQGTKHPYIVWKNTYYSHTHTTEVKWNRNKNVFIFLIANYSHWESINTQYIEQTINTWRLLSLSQPFHSFFLSLSSLFYLRSTQMLENGNNNHKKTTTTW